MKLRLSSAIWALVAVLLTLSLFTHFQILTISFVAVPMLVLYSTLSLRSFVIHVAAIWLVLFLVMGALGSAAILFGMFFTIPAIVMGQLYRKKKSAIAVLLSGTMAFLLQSIILLSVIQNVLDFNLYDNLTTIVNEAMKPLQSAALAPIAWTPEDTDAMITLMSMMIPFALIISSLVMASVTHAVGQRILRKQGLLVSRFKPLREWMLPRSLIWYYLVAVIADLFIANTDPSFMNVIILNLMPLLTLAFVIQTVCFFFFLAHAKRWNGVIPYLLIIPLLLFPPLRIIGILDIAFPIRQSLVKPKM